MNKKKLLNNIENNLDTFRTHFKKIKKEAFQMHTIDIDLLKKKTVNIYEALNTLETVLKGNPEKPEKTFTLPEITPKGEISEKAIVSEKEEIIKTEDKKTEPDVKTESQEMSETPKQENEFIPSGTITSDVKVEEKEEVIEEKPIEQTTETKPESITQNFQKSETSFSEKNEPIKSTVDLFSDSATETIGDKIGSKEQSSIADKMQKSQVNDLRQAIGINEKFLFINELFNGDLGRYNKVIDELNELKTQEGINAYLIELKVANQWPETNEAYRKLKNLLDRKIN